MRQGINPTLLYDDNKQVAGVNLGADFTAEHEQGIQEMKEIFGIPTDISIYGMKRRQITNVPKTLHWIKSNGRAGFVFADWWYEKDLVKLAVNMEKYSELRRPWDKTKHLSTAWDEKSFGVLSDDDTEINGLKSIYDAFIIKDIIIMLGGRDSWIGNAGLLIGIASMMPKETVEKWEQADKEYHEVRKEFEATGIAELLKEKGKQYYALSPRRSKDGGLDFWLNPMEQQDNNCGWFKLDDLKEWAEGKGKIPKELVKK